MRAIQLVMSSLAYMHTVQLQKLKRSSQTSGKTVCLNSSASRGLKVVANNCAHKLSLQNTMRVSIFARFLVAFVPAAAFTPLSPAAMVDTNRHAYYSATAARVSFCMPAHRADLHMQILPLIKLCNLPLLRRDAITTMATMISILVCNGARATEEENVEVYFGCGCFWHVQYDFVQAERKILKRNDLELTALSGYAGGKGGKRFGKVCYHNDLMLSEYDALGHAEVVRLRIPRSAFRQFATEYLALFDEKGNRRGLEYGNVVGIPGGRNVVGIPGGKASPLLQDLIEASKASGSKLNFIIGEGSDPDLAAKAFIMDSTKYPFYQAEVYHQFHDGLESYEDYPDSYNKLTYSLLKAGRLIKQGCPNNMGDGLRDDA